MRGRSLVELRKHDNSVADIIVHSMYILYVLLHVFGARTNGTPFFPTMNLVHIYPSNVWLGVFMPKVEVKTTGKTAVIMFHLE